LPSFEEMNTHTKEWHERETAQDDVKYAIDFQGEYTQMLIDETDYPNFDIKGVNRTFMDWKHNKKDDIMAFRDKSHASLMTGTESPPHHTPWLDALDDSLEAYLKQEK